MTMVSFNISNHPQQVASRGVVREKDERYTPREIIEPLHSEWGFTVDVTGCASAPASRIIGRWWNIEDDGLAQCWDGECCWGNPPFSNLRPWVQKAWDSKARVCLLIPANRTEQAFWQDLIEPYRDNLDGILRTRFIRGKKTSRINFGTPEHPEGGKWASSAPFGCVLLMWRNPWRPDWAPITR